jgi:hypothetical protein
MNGPCGPMRAGVTGVFSTFFFPAELSNFRLPRDNSKGDTVHPTFWMRRYWTVGPKTTNRAQAVGGF